MRKSFINSVTFYTIYWSALLCAVFPVLFGLGYIDEFLAFSIFGIMLLHHVSGKRRIPSFVRLYLFFVCFYFIYSILLSINVPRAVLLDIIQQSKPFVAFMGVFFLCPSISYKKQHTLCYLSLFILIIIIGVIVLLGRDNAIMFFTGHESGYGGLCMLTAILYYYYSERSKRDKIVFFTILVFGLFSGKAKFFGEFCIAVYLFFFCNKRIKVSVKTIVTGGLLLMAILLATSEKIDLYFGSAARNEGDGIARVVLYLRSIDVLKDFFPLGAGFGSYACFASSKYYSPLYYKYEMDRVYGLEPDPQYGNFVADTYYPSIIGEFGVPGIVLLFCFWLWVLRTINNNLKENDNMDDYRMALLLVAVFLIEGIAGPLMLANVGVPIMMLLALILCKSKYHFNASKQLKSLQVDRNAVCQGYE